MMDIEVREEAAPRRDHAAADAARRRAARARDGKRSDRRPPGRQISRPGRQRGAGRTASRMPPWRQAPRARTTRPEQPPPEQKHKRISAEQRHDRAHRVIATAT